MEADLTCYLGKGHCIALASSCIYSTLSFLCAWNHAIMLFSPFLCPFLSASLVWISYRRVDDNRWFLVSSMGYFKILTKTLKRNLYYYDYYYYYYYLTSLMQDAAGLGLS
ncbi:hypothetical protein V8F44DRAFT_528264 [Aspergillus fumigatus]